MSLCNMIPPAPSDNGLFEPVIGMAPPSWPWALPHIYAANVAPEPGEVLEGASADRKGRFFERRGWRTDKGRFEMLGYWGGRFHVVHAETFESLRRARIDASNAFDQLPVRFLMEDGAVKRENTNVEITGCWPEQWSFQRIQDLGVLSAFLYESAITNGAEQQAKEFRTMITFAYPPTEQLLVYIEALEAGRELFGPFLPDKPRAALESGLIAAKKWLR